MNPFNYQPYNQLTIYSLTTIFQSPSQTFVATALRTLRDQQYPPNTEVTTRSPIGPRAVAEQLAIIRQPRWDQITLSQVFEQFKHLAAIDLVADRSQRLVLDLSATTRRPIVD